MAGGLRPRPQQLGGYGYRNDGGLLTNDTGFADGANNASIAFFGNAARLKTMLKIAPLGHRTDQPEICHIIAAQPILAQALIQRVTVRPDRDIPARGSPTKQSL